MTPQGVRTAVREHRLDGTARLLPNGKREYRISQGAIEAYLARGERYDPQVETLEMRLQLAMSALHDKELELIKIGARLEAAEGELVKARSALRDLIRTFVGDDEPTRVVGEAQ